jgi:hypothetical protein
MPRVLRDLRIDEISAVSKGAGEGTRVVLMKRDEPGFYHKLFAKGGSGRVVRPPRRLRGGEPLRDIADAKHALLHSPDGRVLMRDAPTATIDELSAHLLEALSAVTNKRNEDHHMSEHFDVVAFSKRVVDDGQSVISEAQAFELVQKYANLHRQVGERPAVAFARIYGGDDDIGLNFRKMVQISKGIAHPHVGA